MYYLFIFFLLCFGCYTSISTDSKEFDRPIYIILFFCFWFTSGLRFETGVDYAAYDNIYKQANTLTQAMKVGFFSEIPIEPGYAFLNSLFRSFGVEINIMFLFISFVTSLLLFNSLKLYIPKYKFFGLLIYYSYVYFTLDMSGVRQAIAISIILFALRYIQKRQPARFFLLVLLASFFHASALIGIILYWLLAIRISSFNIIISTICGFIIIALKIPIINLIVDGVLSKFMPATAMYKLFVYSTSDVIWALNLKVVLNIIILYILVYFRKSLSFRFPNFNIILNSMFLYVFFREILWESIEINGRINFYVIFGLIMGLPLFLDLVKNKENKLIIYSCIIVLCFYQSNEFYLKTNMHNPYQNYVLFKIFDLKSTSDERFIEYQKSLK